MNTEMEVIAMRRLGAMTVIAVFAIAALMAQGQQKPEKPSPQSFVLRYKGKPGEISRYRSWFILRMVGTFPTPEGSREGRMEYQSEAIYLHKIVSVSEDGTLEIETTKESGKARVGSGEQMKDLPDKPYQRVVKMTDRGKVLEAREITDEEEKEDEDDPRIRYDPTRWLNQLFETAVHNIAFPKQAVKVGDTWREQVTRQMTPNCKVAITINSRFKEVVKLDGKLCAVVDSAIDAPFEGQDTVREGTVGVRGRFSATVTIYFDPEKGDEVQAIDEGRLVLEMTMSRAERSFTFNHRLISRGKTALLD